MKKLKKYRLPISHTFPKTHPKAGQLTYFSAGITLALQGLVVIGHDGPNYPKLHTCRKDYEYWEKAIAEIKAGDAILELYEWIGVPYRSKQRVLFTFYKNSGIGVQKLIYVKNPGCNSIVDGSYITPMTLSRNDGLSFFDFSDWFKDINTPENMAIIHFTKFRY
jgi:hypothetical protein